MEYLDGPGMNSLIIGRDARLRGKRLNLIRQAAEACSISISKASSTATSVHAIMS